MTKISAQRPHARILPSQTNTTPAQSTRESHKSGLNGFHSPSLQSAYLTSQANFTPSAQTQRGASKAINVGAAPAKGLSNPTGARQTTTQAATGATTQAATPVNFRAMSQEQQYNYLKKLTIQRAGGDKSAWKTGDRELNITGIRSFNGTPQGQKVNQYDDMIYVARMVDGKKTVEAFPATVDAGIQAGSGKTPYRLEDGFYKDAWKRGNVSGDELGLRQTKSVEVWTDANNNGVLDPAEIKAGTKQLDPSVQLQIHRGGTGAVGDVSSGCIAIDERYYDRFQQLLAEAPASQTHFSYLATDSSTLPGIRYDGSSQDTYADRGRTGHEKNTGDSGEGIGIIRTPYRLRSRRHRYHKRDK